MNILNFVIFESVQGFSLVFYFRNINDKKKNISLACFESHSTVGELAAAVIAITKEFLKDRDMFVRVETIDDHNKKDLEAAAVTFSTENVHSSPKIVESIRKCLNQALLAA